jgi:hypothetical protein
MNHPYRFVWLVGCLAVLLGGHGVFAQGNFWQQTNGPYGGNINGYSER